MAKTFAKLAEFMRRESANAEVKGRSTAYTINDVMNDGMRIIMTKELGVAMDVDELNELGMAIIKDEMEEVEDDGTLDAY